MSLEYKYKYKYDYEYEFIHPYYQINYNKNTHQGVLNCFNNDKKAMDEKEDNDKINNIYQSILTSGFLTFSYYDTQGKGIHFPCESIITLNERLKKSLLSYHECISLVYCLTTQIQVISELNYCIYGFDINDIILINNNKI
jgi:hypothetical protein